MLLLSLDSSRLRIKELTAQHRTLGHRQTEMQESLQFRLTGHLPPATLPSSQTQHLDQVLGLSTPPP